MWLLRGSQETKFFIGRVECDEGLTSFEKMPQIGSREGKIPHPNVPQSQIVNGKIDPSNGVEFSHETCFKRLGPRQDCLGKSFKFHLHLKHGVAGGGGIWVLKEGASLHNHPRRKNGTTRESGRGGYTLGRRAGSTTTKWKYSHLNIIERRAHKAQCIILP